MIEIIKHIKKYFIKLLCAKLAHRKISEQKIHKIVKWKISAQEISEQKIYKFAKWKIMENK